MYTLYGAPGWGSVIAEAALDLAGLPYQVEDVKVTEAGPGRERSHSRPGVSLAPPANVNRRT